MSDNIVKHGQLKDIAQDLWNKAKARDIERISYDASAKKIKATNSQTPALELEAELTDLVSINDRAEFKQDVSVDDAKTVSNSNVGNINGPVPAGSRTTGYRGLTSKLFTDGYVKLLRIYLPASAGSTIDAHVWMIKKGASKTEDKFLDKKVKNATVVTSGTTKYIDVEIERKFEKETFFVLRTVGSQQIQGIRNIKQGFTEDIINVDDNFNPTVVDELTNWNSHSPNTDFVGHMELHGRTGIVDISKRLEEIGLASGNYVLQSETTNTGGEDRYANKVVKLDEHGKLNKNMLPSIAVNDYFQVDSFTDEKLRALTYENGDVVFDTSTQKRYLCIHKSNTNSTTEFVELNSRDGVVSTVNGQRPGTDGNVTVTAENIKLSSAINTTVKTELDKKISNIALKTGDKKKLTVTKADGQTSDVDLTSAFAADNISYSGQIGGAQKNNVKEAIDALNTEVNKGVKSVKGGRPNANGELDVTVNTAGNGIAMTFGNSNTPVTIATYMTDTEVSEIKALFR